MNGRESKPPSPPRSAKRSRSSPASIWQAGLRRAVRKAAHVASPPPELTVSQWADRNLRLSPEDSGEHGQYQSIRAPYQRAIMDACSDPTIESVVCHELGASRENHNHQSRDRLPYRSGSGADPGDLPDAGTGRGVFQGSAGTDDPRYALPSRARSRMPKARDSGNTLLHKNFPGGRITIVGANSPAGLAARPIRIVVWSMRRRDARAVRAPRAIR